MSHTYIGKSLITYMENNVAMERKLNRKNKPAPDRNIRTKIVLSSN